MMSMLHLWAHLGRMVYGMSSRWQRTWVHMTVMVSRHAHVHSVICLWDTIDERLGVLTRQHVCLVILAFSNHIMITSKLQIFNRFTSSWWRVTHSWWGVTWYSGRWLQRLVIFRLLLIDNWNVGDYVLLIFLLLPIFGNFFKFPLEHELYVLVVQVRWLRGGIAL